MPTEIDHGAIKTRIKAILEANTSLYDPNNTDGDRLLSVDLGFPFNNDSVPQIMPSAFIYLSSETITRSGIVQSNVHKALEHDVNYNIVFIVAESDSKTTEAQLDTFQKEILETLEGNAQLDLSSDPKVDTSTPERVDTLRQDFNGQVVQGRIITLNCMISTG